MTEVSMDGYTITMIITIVGCFLGLAAWMSRRDSKTALDAEWRGEIKGTLNSILIGNGVINDKVKGIEEDMRTICIQQAKTESKAESAHKRLDEHIQNGVDNKWMESAQRP